MKSPGVSQDGIPRSVNQAEAVLNWQTDNARAQNTVLQRLESKVDKVSLQINSLDTQVSQQNSAAYKLMTQLQAQIADLHTQLMTMISQQIHGSTFGSKAA